jgi:hypothetical protein
MAAPCDDPTKLSNATDHDILTGKRNVFFKAEKEWNCIDIDGFNNLKPFAVKDMKESVVGLLPDATITLKSLLTILHSFPKVRAWELTKLSEHTSADDISVKVKVYDVKRIKLPDEKGRVSKVDDKVTEKLNSDIRKGLYTTFFSVVAGLVSLGAKEAVSRNRQKNDELIKAAETAKREAAMERDRAAQLQADEQDIVERQARLAADIEQRESVLHLNDAKVMELEEKAQAIAEATKLASDKTQSEETRKNALADADIQLKESQIEANDSKVKETEGIAHGREMDRLQKELVEKERLEFEREMVEQKREDALKEADRKDAIAAEKLKRMELDRKIAEEKASAEALLSEQKLKQQEIDTAAKEWKLQQEQTKAYEKENQLVPMDVQHPTDGTTLQHYNQNPVGFDQGAAPGLPVREDLMELSDDEDGVVEMDAKEPADSNEENCGILCVVADVMNRAILPATGQMGSRKRRNVFLENVGRFAYKSIKPRKVSSPSRSVVRHLFPSLLK